MGRKLSDFDLVYAYPWPEEHQLYRNVMREYGGPNSVFLTYDVRRGMELQRFYHPSTDEPTNQSGVDRTGFR
jgi:hypothetical protein